MVQHLKSWLKSLFKPLPDEPETPTKDPVVNSSLAVPLAVSSLLLILSLFWAFYEEGWGLRPWVGYQSEFARLYAQALENMKPGQVAREQDIYNSADYQELKAGLEERESNIRPRLESISAEEDAVRAQLAAVTKTFANARSQIQAKLYELETASDSAKESLRQELEELRQVKHPIDLSEGEQQLDFAALEEMFNSLKQRQGELQTQKVAVLSAPTLIRREMDEYRDNRLTGLTGSQLSGLKAQVENMDVAIRQIHNAEMGLVDRCESCHMGVLAPVELTAEMMSGQRLFVSHSRPDELLGIHDPEIFGCSPCHNGNGVGTVSTTRAHGLYKHWLWPLYAPENVEAGCVKCHQQDHYLPGASTLNAGRDLFWYQGCVGCHAREGYATEDRLIRENQKEIQDLVDLREASEIKIERLLDAGDVAETNEEANRLYADGEAVTLQIADIDTDLDRLRVRGDELLLEVKKIGPNLKEVRNKLRRDWIPDWIRNPQAFRPTTKMPQFRVADDEVEAIAAFIWQSSLEADLPRQAAGDAVRGQELFESRGCLGCHSVGQGDQNRGGDFAANLSRVGEKVNYDYLVRWVHDPRERTFPYCPLHQRDILPSDYASQGLPFQFGLDNDQCPLGDHTLLVQNQVLMPMLGLTEHDSRDIASYLMTLKQDDATYTPAAYMEDPELVEKGRFLVRHLGCAGCHEIAGLENESKVGTDLTMEGSKPIERLDFALLTHDAKKEGWYNHKGFFENKLRQPEIYDEGKIKTRLEELRMPDFHLNGEEIDQLTTFLLGSVETPIPQQFHYLPAGSRRDVQEGWWLIKKYNCMGCHELVPGQTTALEGLERYQGDGSEKLPPSLIGEGARAKPDWLARFLKNPPLSDTETNRNGIRPYLDVRMPTFNFSDGEVQKLVNFFQAMAKQPAPYLPPKLEPLSANELTLARQLFTSQAAPCLTCHATGEAGTDSEKTAPSFALTAERLKPDWSKRWIVHPEIIRPGTAMPSGLFRLEDDRWVFALARLQSFESYRKDHADLVVRYMFQFTPQEERRLLGR